MYGFHGNLSHDFNSTMRICTTLKTIIELSIFHFNRACSLATITSNKCVKRNVSTVLLTVDHPSQIMTVLFLSPAHATTLSEYNSHTTSNFNSCYQAYCILCSLWRMRNTRWQYKHLQQVFDRVLKLKVLPQNNEATSPSLIGISFGTPFSMIFKHMSPFTI